MEQQLRAALRSSFQNLTPAIAPRVQQYGTALFRKDALAGLTIAAIIIPNALGYAILAGLPPVMGLYAAIPAIICAALWGSSSHVITAPVGIVSLLAASSLAAFAQPLSPEYISLAIALAFCAGLIQVILGISRLGILARLIPHSALAGFTNAAALLIAITQLPTVLGLVGIENTGIYTLADIITQLPAVHIVSASLGVTTVVGILCMKRYAPTIPGSLLALLCGLILALTTDLEALGVVSIGHIPSGIPQFTFSAFSIPVLYLLFKQACLIALVGFVETYSIAQSIAKNTKERISADKELVGQGMANMSAGLLGGFPVSGSFSGSALNVKSGASTNVAALVAGVTMFFAVLALSPLLAHMPRAILSGVVIAAVMQLIDIRSIKELFSLSRMDGTIAIVTGVSALLLRPDDALLIGIMLGISLFVLRSMRLSIHEVGYHRTHESLWSRESTSEEELEVYPNVLVLRFDTSLIFVNADMLMEIVTTHIKNHEAEFNSKVTAVVLNGAGLNYLDAAGIDALRELQEYMRERTISLHFMLIKDSVISIMQRANLYDASRYMYGPRELSQWAQSQQARK